MIKQNFFHHKLWMSFWATFKYSIAVSYRYRQLPISYVYIIFGLEQRCFGTRSNWYFVFRVPSQNSSTCPSVPLGRDIFFLLRSVFHPVPSQLFRSVPSHVFRSVPSKNFQKKFFKKNFQKNFQQNNNGNLNKEKWLVKRTRNELKVSLILKMNRNPLLNLKRETSHSEPISALGVTSGKF